MADPQGLTEFLASLRRNESGDDYTARSKYGSASGAYQYIDSTWNNYGGYAHAWQAPPEVQDKRAREDALRHYNQFGGDWDKVAAAHFAGAGWVLAHPDKSTWNQNPVPGSVNPTVARYVSRVTGSNFGSVTASTTSTGGAMTTPTKPVTDSELIAYARTNYGYLAGFLSIPELKTVLLKAAKEGWDTGRLQGAVYATSWWKKTAEVTRQWVALQSTDPAEAAKRLNDRKRAVTTMAQQMGVTLSANDLATIATSSLKYGWGDQQLQSGVAGHFHYNPQGNTGAGAVTVGALKDVADDYLVPLSDATLQNWTTKILAGTLSVDSFTQYVKNQAKSRFPGIAGFIDGGGTVRHFADPYVEQAAQLLETTPEQIKLTDSRWLRMVDQRDPKTGDHTAMSLADAADYVRSQPEWGHTKQAHAQGAQVASIFLDAFGKAAI